MVLAAQQILEIGQLSVFKTVEVSLNKALQNKVEFKQGTAAMPAHAPLARLECLIARHRSDGVHTARCTIRSLIFPIARVGFSPFGQTSTQFMIEWQRNNRYGSSRLSRRSLVAWSRVSAMKR